MNSAQNMAKRLKSIFPNSSTDAIPVDAPATPPNRSGYLKAAVARDSGSGGNYVSVPWLLGETMWRVEYKM